MAKRSGPTWNPKPADYLNVFAEQNPWHRSGEVPTELAHPVERSLAKILWRRVKNDTPRRFQLILGPRRVGKTTTMYQSLRYLLAAGVKKEKLWWLRLDHPLLMQMRLDVLVRFATDYTEATKEDPIYLFLDELTYAKDWDLWLKAFYDDQWPVKIIGTSSSTAAIRDRHLESGVGRWEEQYMPPYLFTEYLALMSKQVNIVPRSDLAGTIENELTARSADLNEIERLRKDFLLTGGFPELLLLDRSRDPVSAVLKSQRVLKSDAVEKAIYKDIPQAFGVDNPILLERMLYTLAGQCAGLLSPANLCQNLDGLSQPTFDKYLSYLSQSFLVFTLPNYSGSEASIQKRGRKLFFIDGAIRNAALQRGLSPLSDSVEMGLLIENMAASHLHALSQQSQARIFHWRDGNDEVDLIYDQPDRPMAFEVGHSPNHSRTGLHRLMERHKRFVGGCYIVAPGAPMQPSGMASDGIGSIPFDLFVVAVGSQAEAELSRRIVAVSGAS